MERLEDEMWKKKHTYGWIIQEQLNSEKRDIIRTLEDTVH